MNDTHYNTNEEVPENKMPGRWPVEPMSNAGIPRGLHLGTTMAPPKEPTPQVQRADSPTSSQSSRDEVFFDCPAPGARHSDTIESEEAFPSYLIFEPIVESVSGNDTIDWRRYDPPKELAHTQARTSIEIQKLLAISIERIQARHVEEENTRAAAARQERPLARVGRVSAKPNRHVPVATDIGSTRNHLSPRSSASSEESISSFDSGYALNNSSRTSSKKHLGLVSSLFKRKERTAVDRHPLDGLRENRSSSSTLTTGLAKISIPESGDLHIASLTGECVSCLDDFSMPELIQLSCHSYCHNCFLRLVKNALDSEIHWPVKCCLNTIPSTKILYHMSGAMRKKYQQREIEWAIPTGDRIYCARPDCGAWIPPKNIKTQSHSARCPVCAHKVCITCRGPFHTKGDCPQDPNLQATINLAELEGWKRCYSCQALVEHNKGCRHMTCRCKAQFCYICGSRWRTCACTDVQLTEIQEAAQSRRHEQTVRTARQAALAEEERLILQMVADFERAEAEREAIEAEAERRRLEVERRKREEQHIEAVNRHFHELATELDLLHNIQQVHMAERHEFELDIQRKDRQDLLDTLSLRHPAETQFLHMESQKKISDFEYRFNQEYQVRLAEERCVEDQYVDELHKYWNGKPDSEYRIRNARDELRKDQDKDYRFWDAYRRKQLQAVVEGEKRKMENLIVKQQSEIKAVNGRAEIDAVEWRRKVSAEEKWAEEVRRERLVVLRELEQAEYTKLSRRSS